VGGKEEIQDDPVHGELPAATLDTERTLVLSEEDEQNILMIDNKPFDPNRVDQEVKRSEVMELRRHGELPSGSLMDRLWSRRQTLRQLGSAVAAGAVGAALPITAAAQEDPGWNGQPPSQPGQAPPDFLGFDLDASAPQTFAGGAIRTLTHTEMPALDGLALFDVRFDPGGMGELHWHSNASELGYQLAGHGEVGVFSTDGTGTIMPIEPGSVTFIPRGSFHYFRNLGDDQMHRAACFAHAAPETYLLSATLPPVPQTVLAQTFALGPADSPFLAARGTEFVVDVPGIGPQASAAAPNPYTVQAAAVDPTTYAGGTVREIGPTDIPTLDGLTVTPMQIDRHGLREPHWHTNANELAYCLRGSAQVGIVAPDGSAQTFVIGPGGAAFVPVNWFHYIANVGGDPVELLAFYSSATPLHIDLSQGFGFYPPEIIAASFGLDPALFAGLPIRGDVVIAPAPATDQGLPAATPTP
jgi:oxalate decarboxylase